MAEPSTVRHAAAAAAVHPARGVRYEDVLDAVRGGCHGTRGVAEKVHTSYRVASRMLAALVQVGALTRTGGNGRHGYTFKIAARG